jgi:CopC domain
VTAPKQVSIWFTEEVEPAFSRIEVTDSSGTRIDEGGTHIDANRELLHVWVKPLSPGTYKVTWHIMSVDTASYAGRFHLHRRTITVRPAIDRQQGVTRRVVCRIPYLPMARICSWSDLVWSRRQVALWPGRPPHR